MTTFCQQIQMRTLDNKRRIDDGPHNERPDK